MTRRIPLVILERRKRFLASPEGKLDELEKARRREYNRAYYWRPGVREKKIAASKRYYARKRLELAKAKKIR